MTTIIITGMNSEAQMVGGNGVSAFACGGNVAMHEQAIREAAAQGAKCILSVGIAGGLAPGLRAGQWIVAPGVRAGDRRIACNKALSAKLAKRLNAAVGDILTVSAPVREVAQKRQLHQQTKAFGVDMESFAAAVIAKDLGLPFAAARVVVDPCERALPPAAAFAMLPDGSLAMRSVLKAVLKNPIQCAGLMQLSWDLSKSFCALWRARKMFRL